MKKIYMNLHNVLEIGDDYPTILMGVLNLSQESFYQGSVYSNMQSLENATHEMIENGATILDLGARSTAPWSQKITVDEEIDRLQSAMKLICKIIPDDIIISVDTQYRRVAEVAFNIYYNICRYSISQIC
jgi:dihydropteroate synthase